MHCTLRDCSVSYMFVSRFLPTCNMLIRKNVYSFLPCIARSGNAILQSIMNSDALYTSPLCRHWRKILYIYIVISHTLVFFMDVMFGNKVIKLN